MNTTTSSSSNNTTAQQANSGNGNIGGTALYNNNTAGVRPPPPPPSSSSSSSSQTNKSHTNNNHHHHHHHHHHKRDISTSSSQNSINNSNSNNSNSSNNNINKDPINSKISEFQCKLKFQNSLPEIPFEPKFLKLSSDFQRFTQYKTTSLERQYKHPLLTEPQLGIPIDLIDPSVYNTPKSPIQVPPGDEPLLKPLSQQDLEEKNSSAIFKKKSEIRPNVGWLRRTEYLSKSDENTFGRPTKRISTSGELLTSSSSGSNTPNNKQLSLAQEQLSDSVLVENTFDICASDYQFVHPTNPSLKPVSVLQVFPDFDLWANSFTEVTFDSDPLDHFLPKDLRSDKVQEYASRHNEVRNKAIVKGITDKFVYFITPDLKENYDVNNNNDFEIDDSQYKMQKVLTSDIITDATSQNYFFLVKNDAVYYNPLKNRVNLKKIKSKDDKLLVRTKIGRPESITYKKRPQNSKELDAKEIIINDLLQEEKAPFSNKKLKRSNKLSDDEDI
ncbi:RNA polymerase II-associated factor 1 [Dictyostelium discoideum AX4]|uniref:RNA polymerase II-associated factor 1 n=1 Tax=Dictyostelium discoideum TaxID=44689 RepID=Q55E33_DICDI|nr:RNA polymerase II-associated factor 1 [Dictyostelium discoideum AX4]EAL72056.1 RNA polymerase II-associated factor 1 [Dictyostelium discoideum AX4]|eukprot:XP_645948.1 RNA polymerase II-associated factor 1 [Dictyostelium discoideum AX4]